MNMKFNLVLILAIAVCVTVSGCGGGSDSPTNSSNANVANANANQVSTNTTLEPIKKPEAATTNNAPTIGPVVQKYYEALRKKDDALLKSVMSQEFIKSIEADMKAEGKTGSFAAFVAEVESDLDKPVEVRNEKIEGDNAVAEVKGGVYLAWTPFAFVNEGGKWKFTGGSPVLK
jgi:hypothetical protein